MAGRAHEAAVVALDLPMACVIPTAPKPVTIGTEPATGGVK